MAELWTNPSLNRNTVASTDLLICASPVTNGSGQITGYTPYNIEMSYFSSAVVSIGLLSLMPNLPTIAPEGGGLWLDNGHLAYSNVTGSASGTPLSVDALAASLRNLMTALPAMGASTTLDGFQNNDGIVQDTTGKKS